MSHQPSHEHPPPPEAQAEEGIAWGSVLGVGVGWTIVFAISILIVVKVLNAREKALQPNGPDPLPAQIQKGSAEVGIVDQAPFGITHSAQAYRSDRVEKLQSWGWVDRKAGTVRMPISEAMDRVVKERHR